MNCRTKYLINKFGTTFSKLAVPQSLNESHRMYEWMQLLLNNAGFMPQGQSFLWNSNLIRLFTLADGLLVAACYSIALAIFYFVRRRHDLKNKRIFIAFAIFIFVFGSAQLISLWNLWNHSYWLQAYITLFAGVTAIYVAALIWIFIPKALAIPSRDAIENAYSQLEKAHQELMAKENTYQVLTQTLGEGLWMLDDVGTITSVNARMIEMLGYSEEEILGHSMYDFIDEEFVDHARHVMQKQRGGYDRDEFTFTRKNGEPLYAIVSMTAITDSFDRVSSIMALVTDITERESIAREMTRLTTQQEILIKQRTQSLAQRERKMRAIVHANIDAIVTINGFGKITTVNPATETMFGYSPDRLIGKNVSMLMPEPYASQHDHYLISYVHGGTPGVIGKRRELEGRRASGEIFPLELAVTEVKGESEQFFVGVLRDISERKLAQQAIENLNEELRQINENLNQEIHERKKAESETKTINAKLGIFIRDLQSYTEDIHQLNEMSDFLQACNNLHELSEVIRTFSYRFFGAGSGALYLLKDEQLYLHDSSWGSDFNPQESFSLAECWAMRNSKIHPATKAQENLICHHFQPTDHHTHTCIPLYARAKQVGLLVLYAHSRLWGQDAARNANRAQLLQAFADHVAGAISNQTLRALLQEQSTRDPLTGLHNRRFLSEQLHLEISRSHRDQKSFGILLTDVDHFKSINDNFGHDVGDQVLKTLAEHMQTNIRASDILCRFGGEEFIFLLPETDLQHSYVIAEKLRRRIAQQPHDFELDRPVTVSIGVACFPEHGETAEELLKAADLALYEAKNRGRNRSVMASDILDQS